MSASDGKSSKVPATLWVKMDGEETQEKVATADCEDVSDFRKAIKAELALDIAPRHLVLKFGTSDKPFTAGKLLVNLPKDAGTDADHPIVVSVPGTFCSASARVVSHAREALPRDRSSVGLLTSESLLGHGACGWRDGSVLTACAMLPDACDTTRRDAEQMAVPVVAELQEGLVVSGLSQPQGLPVLGGGDGNVGACAWGVRRVVGETEAC